MPEPTPKPNGPVYSSWDEAMADPNLDLTRPWFVVPGLDLPPGVYQAPADGLAYEWPPGWTDIGYTTEGAVFPEDQP